MADLVHLLHPIQEGVFPVSDHDLRLSEALARSRSIWAGKPAMRLDHVATAACTVTGDIARDHHEGAPVNDAGLRKELGNLILSATRWAADLGHDPAQCVAEAAAI